MSTADGLVVSSSQIIANDLYRRTVAPRLHPDLAEDALDRRVLFISRVATVVVLLICLGMAWLLLNVNITLIVWIGSGGMMAAFAGPLVVGALWRGVTRAGAYAGLVIGFAAFVTLHMQLLNPDWFASGLLRNVVAWLYAEGPTRFPVRPWANSRPSRLLSSSPKRRNRSPMNTSTRFSADPSHSRCVGT